MCRPNGPGENLSLVFRIIDNRPARGAEEWNGSVNATLPLQLLLAATATGAENPTYRFVIISHGSRFPHVPLSLSLCLSISVSLSMYLWWWPTSTPTSLLQHWRNLLLRVTWSRWSLLSHPSHLTSHVFWQRNSTKFIINLIYKHHGRELASGKTTYQLWFYIQIIFNQTVKYDLSLEFFCFNHWINVDICPKVSFQICVVFSLFVSLRFSFNLFHFKFATPVFAGRCLSTVSLTHHSHDSVHFSCRWYLLSPVFGGTVCWARHLGNATIYLSLKPFGLYTYCLQWGNLPKEPIKL